MRAAMTNCRRAPSFAIAALLLGGCGDRAVLGPKEPECLAGETVCAGECVNTSQDVAHCGGCGQACEVGQVCSLGVCSGGCDDGLTECDGGCADTDSDPDHCGACGAA